MMFPTITINACYKCIVFNYNLLCKNSVKPCNYSVFLLKVFSSGFMLSAKKTTIPGYPATTAFPGNKAVESANPDTAPAKQ